MPDREPLPNPEIVIRKLSSVVRDEPKIVTYFVPETIRAEEWLLAQSLCSRPEPRLDKDGNFSSRGRGGVRGSVVDKQHITAVRDAAVAAGFVVRRVR